jgi:hypothetical protein
MSVPLSHNSQYPLFDTGIESLIIRILNERRITRTDQQCLMSALLSKEALTSEEHNQINRVFDALRRGLIRVVD